MDRKRIGIIYLAKRKWIGGAYYIQNFIKAINILEDNKKPIIDVYTEDIICFDELTKETRYPYLVYNVYHERAIFVFLTKCLRKFALQKSYLINPIKFRNDDLFIFPYNTGRSKNNLSWIPDFQDKYLSTLFTDKELKYRDAEYKNVVINNYPLVLSSYDCASDFSKFYPSNKNRVHILHFAVSLPDFSSVDFDSLINKYKIRKKYLFCANQFWKHKNHLALFKSFKKALDGGLDMELICTGEMYDHRNPEYIEEIKEFLKNNNLNNKIKVLGFISREEMLCLMKNSYAVIQPSLFEGWSTVVEDCKALGKFMFLSNLNVHKEQINTNVCFFDPHDINDLSQKLIHIKPIETEVDYSINVKEFANAIYKVIESY